MMRMQIWSFYFTAIKVIGQKVIDHNHTEQMPKCCTEWVSRAQSLRCKSKLTLRNKHSYVQSIREIYCYFSIESIKLPYIIFSKYLLCFFEDNRWVMGNATRRIAENGCNNLLSFQSMLTWTIRARSNTLFGFLCWLWLTIVYRRFVFPMYIG